VTTPEIRHHAVAVLVGYLVVIDGDEHAAMDRAKQLGAEIAAAVPDTLPVQYVLQGLSDVRAAGLSAYWKQVVTPIAEDARSPRGSLPTG
jgi:hypothetical protein